MVKIRMKKLGRKHRHFFRIVAIDSRQPRDGRVIEELGSYDPFLDDKTKRVVLKPDRIKYWQSVGAQTSERCQLLFNKFMEKAAPVAAEPAAAAQPPIRKA